MGIGSSARAAVPVRVSLPADTVEVQGGTDFTVALTATGQVWTWGGNRYGQLGTDSGTARLKPAQVRLPGRDRASSISVGADHVLVLTRSGSVFGWGHNAHGQLGDGTTTDRHEPVRIAASSVVQLATGVASSYAVTKNGALLAWGRPMSRDGTSSVSTSRQTRPVRFDLPGGAKAAMVDAGERHLVVVTRRDQLLTFGVDPGGRLLPTRMPIPRISGRVTSISSGDHHTVALTSTRTVLAWGANYHGQLGTRDTANRDSPVVVRIPNLRGHVVQVVAGGDSVLVRTSRGEVYVWGQGRFGQNANGKDGDATRPHRVDIPRVQVTGVHAGRYHHLVLVKRQR